MAVVGPQPDWRDAETFVAHYHAVQLVPYAFGFLLVSASVMMILSLARAGGPAAGWRPGLAMVATSLFAAFIFLNYVIQTTFVPSLVAHYRPELGVVIEALSMRNPRSLGWAVEMWGYAMLGLAAWLVASVFDDTPLERAAAWSFATNGVISVAGGVITAARLDWVFAPVGLAFFFIWNLLMLLLAGLTVFVWRRRLARLSAQP